MASPTTGDVGGKIGQAAGGIGEKLLDGVSDDLGKDTIEGQITGVIADLAKPVLGMAGKAIGNAVGGDQGNQANTGGNQGAGGQANSGKGQQQQQQPRNGGNTVQIPTIFLMVLAIFNH